MRTLQINQSRQALQRVNMFHRINNIEQEERLLTEMLKLQSDIRRQREDDRLQNSTRREKYTKIFEPVTSTLQALKPSKTTPVTTPGTPPPSPPSPALITFDEGKPETEKPENILDIREPGELYKKALSAVSRKARDDGELGLNPTSHTIGDYTYEVEDNVLKVFRIAEEGRDEKEFEIEDYDLWRLLLVLNPNKIQLKTVENGQLLPFVVQYRKIAEELELLKNYDQHVGSNKRVKYKLLTHRGSGFLFSVRPPTLIAPDTVIIPSDNVFLMNSLYRALAEFRAGNSSMRNVVVPLAAEARRKKILPTHLLSDDEETWVFA